MSIILTTADLGGEGGVAKTTKNQTKQKAKEKKSGKRFSTHFGKAPLTRGKGGGKEIFTTNHLKEKDIFKRGTNKRGSKNQEKRICMRWGGKIIQISSLEWCQNKKKGKSLARDQQ